jgi:uncharacterized protein involved in exopolysaccharide biosynthesis/Mrp family chromosome partitioning ATPase
LYNRLSPVNYQPISARAPHERPLDIGVLVQVLYTNALTILLSAALFGGLALAYVLLTPPTFQATAQLMISAQKGGTADDQPTVADEMVVASQMEIIKSGEVLKGVVTDLSLTSDPEFTSDGFSVSDMLYWLLALVLPNTGGDSSAATSQDVKVNEVVEALRRQLLVRRVEQSTVMEVIASSIDPQKAAAIANSVANHYLSHDIATRSLSAQRSSEWLAQRVTQLRDEVLAADRAATQFQASGDASDKFKLAELKSVSDTARRLYETYLLNLADSRQRISYPVSDAELVSQAVAPRSKSAPRAGLIMLFTVLLGTTAGIVFATVRHFRNRVVLSADRIGLETDLPCISQVAIARGGAAKEKASKESPSVDKTQRSIGDPKQRFGRDMRDLYATVSGLRRNRKARLIGFLSAEAGAGATTMVYNVALLASASGCKTLLVDAAAANPKLSKMFTKEGSPGLMELLNSPEAYADFIAGIDRRLTILPIGTINGVTPGERIASERVSFNLADLKEQFDLILVDLPSMPDSADAKAIAPHLDGSVVVVRHGKTSFDALGTVVDAMRDVGAMIFGVVLNAIPSPRKRGTRP